METYVFRFQIQHVPVGKLLAFQFKDASLTVYVTERRMQDYFEL